MRDSRRVGAAQLAQFYFRTAFEKAGVNWEGDNDTEVASMVDLIIDAAVAQSTTEMHGHLRVLREQISVVSSALDMHEGSHTNA